MKVQRLTICFPLQGESVLLGLKKRGFGQGWWNGFGGKVEAGETVHEAALRELAEETGLQPIELEHVADLAFTFEQEPGKEYQVDAFLLSRFLGEPNESEEMKPQWFPVTALPYDRMWPADQLWIPRVLKGERIQASFHYGENRGILRYSIEPLDEN